jgi:hypothetical protein
MPIEKHVYARATRDRIIDLLGLGETYPLRDVTVEEDQLTVDFNAPSKFEIEPAQEDVEYALYEHDQPVKPAGSVTRGGEIVTLGGPVITDDRVFQIHAAKIRPPERATFLLGTAKIRVGLNTGLRAWISGGSLLNPLSSGDLDFRVTDYGTTVDVRVQGAQALVRYQLIYPGPGGATISTTLTDEVPVNGKDLTLTTGTVTEDTQIDVHMTRTFEPSEARKNLEGYLERQPHALSPPPWNTLKLPLAVRANPALLVSIQGASMDGSPLVDPLGSVTITLASSQTSVEHSVFARPLLDADFELAPPPPDAPALLPPITVPASPNVLTHDVHVHAPPRPDPWTVQDGYVLHGQPTAGNGGDLTLSIGPFESDTVFVIKARKTHPGGQSALQLEHALVALPRPKPAPALSLVLSQSGQLSVAGGQHGVFYHFRRIGQTDEIGLPAYFHRLDEADPQQNRGVGQLRIETDFAVARDPDDPNALQTDPAYQPVPDPVVNLTDVPPPGEDSVSVMAVHARTGVGWVASQTFPITRQ